MDKIHMVDLLGQYKKIKDDVDKAILDVIESTAFINGPQVKQLNSELSEYLGCKHSICCANGTDALQIALMALGLKPGDEVIVPDFTFIATAEVIALLGLKPVFVDICPETYVLDTGKLLNALSPKTKAVIPVHLYGQCANMEEIMGIANNHGIYIIEDNAQAFGAETKVKGVMQKAGTIGHIGCSSFFPSKNLGCFGDGGALFTNDEKLAEKIACIANHGARVKYFHERVGLNSRLDTLQAAILLVKLSKIDEYISARQQAAEKYDFLLGSIEQIKVPVRAAYSTHVFHQYTIQAKNRNELQKFLAEKNIPTMIYYPAGMHNQEAYKTAGNFPVSEMLCKSVLSLPMHTELSIGQQEYIAKSIKEFYNK